MTGPSKAPGLTALDDIIFKVTKQKLTCTDKNSKTSVTSNENKIDHNDWQKGAAPKEQVEGTQFVQGNKRVRRASARGLVSNVQNSDGSRASSSLEKEQNTKGSWAAVKKGRGRPRKTDSSDNGLQSGAVEDNVSRNVPKVRGRKRKGTTDLNEPNHKKVVQSRPTEKHVAQMVPAEHDPTENTTVLERRQNRRPKQQTPYIENKLLLVNPNLTTFKGKGSKLDPKAVTVDTDGDGEKKGSNIFEIMETNSATQLLIALTLTTFHHQNV